MQKLTVKDLDINGHKVFLRVDFNVPINSEGKISDTTRIDLSLPTIDFLLQKKARLALVSHLGRPKKVSKEFSLAPVAEYLSQKLANRVRFCTSIIGEPATLALNELSAGECLLFDNIRFYPQEEKNDLEFSRQIAANFDFYVNDAFGSAHRAHASTHGIASCFANPAAGLLMVKEIEVLQNMLHNPPSPFVVVLGGSKVSDKLPVINNLLRVTDKLLLGGGMAYTFLKAKAKDIGKSLFDQQSYEAVQQALQLAEKLHKEIVLPVDHLVAKDLDSAVSTVQDIAHDDIAFDIGPKTIALYREHILGAKQIFWNGPMGVFEHDNFNKGTFGLALAINDSAGYSVVGGGDSVAAIYKSGYTDNIGHISTGGGASLEMLEGKKLPGVEILADK